MDRDCCRASKRSMLQGHHCKATHGFSQLSVCFLGLQNSILDLGESDEMSWKFPSFFKKRRGEKKKKKNIPHMHKHTLLFFLTSSLLEVWSATRVCENAVKVLTF